MFCEWGHDKCLNEPKQCPTCITKDFHYKPPKTKTPKKTKAVSSNRAGAAFESRNHDRLHDTLIRQTPNSGAGRIKGDEEIKGIIEIMEELKTSNKETSRGKKTISIQKEWLMKLDKEAKAAHKEFWYLKFCFGDYDRDTFIVVDEDVIMSMVATMINDRQEAKRLALKEDEYKKEINYLSSKIDYLKAKIKSDEYLQNGDVL